MACGHLCKLMSYALLESTHAKLEAHITLRYVQCRLVTYRKSSVEFTIYIQVNKKFRKFERKYRDCIKRNGDKIGTQTCYKIST